MLLDIEGTICPISFVKETLVGAFYSSERVMLVRQRDYVEILSAAVPIRLEIAPQSSSDEVERRRIQNVGQIDG